MIEWVLVVLSLRTNEVVWTDLEHPYRTHAACMAFPRLPDRAGAVKAECWPVVADHG